MLLKKMEMLFSLSLTLFMASCVSTTGTITTASSADLSNIKKAAIVVKAEKEMSVRVARDNGTNTGAALFGLLGAGVEAAYRSSKDTAYVERVAGRVGDFDPVKEFGSSLIEKFAAAKLFPVAEAIQPGTNSSLQAQGFDAMFEQSIKEWGLRLCSGEENVRVAFDTHARLMVVQNNRILWERDELFMEGACRPLADFQTDPDLLRTSLKRATNNLAARITNDIAFP